VNVPIKVEPFFQIIHDIELLYNACKSWFLVSGSNGLFRGSDGLGAANITGGINAGADPLPDNVGAGIISSDD